MTGRFFAVTSSSRDAFLVLAVLLVLAINMSSLVGVQGRAVKIKTANKPQATDGSQGPNDEKIFNANMHAKSAGGGIVREEEALLTGSLTDVCGKRPILPPRQNESSTRVVAGIESSNRWPWQVALVNKTSEEQFCGGTLIGRDHILTAAHCFDSGEWHEDNIIIVLGEHDRSRPEGTEQRFAVDCIHIHSQYVNGVPYNNDIAVVKLRTAPDNDVIINDYVMPACMPEKNEFQAGDTCYVTGWGYTNFLDFTFGRRPDIINQARLPILSRKDCRGAYGSFISNRMICAGYLEGERRADTCKGDSGGPLVCQQVDGSWKLVGVTSWGENTFCNPSPRDAVPGVYTKVGKYRKWITKTVDMKKCQTRS
ncbi:chymotrypsinogen A-like [Acanthaster planci]|uniref:Chymotrypsinogen A-like n=1 Tax=Acanthaster planci TaxID=133434 RepID=A0A8B7ZCX9_ACAPL|nr:chymotrypsinogen A-like [Acanthaster planci]